MGGESVQMAFMSQNSKIPFNLKKNLKNIYVGGKKYFVFSKSWMRYLSMIKCLSY